MGVDKAALEKLMAPLRRNYQLQLEKWLGEMEPIYDHVKNRCFIKEELEILRLRAHSMHGTGSTYGFNDISEAARNLESILLSDDPAVDLSTPFDVLLTACKHAIKNII